MSRFFFFRFVFSLGLLTGVLSPAGAAPSPLDTLPPARRTLELGIGCYRRGQLDSAARLLNQALRLARAGTRPDTLTMLKVYNNLGNVAIGQGHQPQALAAYQQALSLADATHDRCNTAKIGNNIGAMFRDLNRLDQALRYFAQAEREARALQDATLLAESSNNIGLVYEQRQQYGPALARYQQALRFYEKARQLPKVAMVLSNLAIVQKRRNDYPASLASTRRALAIAQATGDQWLAAATLNNLGNTLVEMKRPLAAQPYLQQALAQARRLRARELVVASLETLAQAAAAAGQHQAAYEYERTFAEQKDSLVTVESYRQLSELQVKYNTEQQRRENEQLRYQNRLRTLAQQRAEQDRRRTIQLAGGGIFTLLLLTSAAGYYRRQRWRQRETQNLNQALFEGEQQERVRLARDLHDGVGQHLAVVRMYVSELLEGGPDAAAHATYTLELVDKTIQEVRTVSHNLIPDELNFGFFAALRELSRRVSQGGTLKLHLDVAEDLREHSLPRELELSLYRVVQEVVNGMIRHAQATEISIRCVRHDPHLVVQLADNGRGFDTSQLTESTGLGWKNIRARVGLLGGELQVRSGRGRGTHVRIAVPE